MPKRKLGREDQRLFQDLQRALQSDEPLDLLAQVSGFLEVTDPRSADPFAGGDRPGREDLIESFIGTRSSETTAALTAMHALVPDEPTRARIGQELAARCDPMPGWLSALARAEVEPDVWYLTHILGDGDDYLFGVTLPTGQALSALVYVDHNLGTVVKDAFVVPEELEDLAIKIGISLDDPDQSLTRTDPATARAVVTEAIEVGSRIYRPLTSDSWPICRPLVEWMLRQLPAGGVAPRPKAWSEPEIATIATEFFASPFGAPFAEDDDRRRLVESVLRFGTGYATGDPFRWSPVTVELLLVDWVPRKIIAEPSFLAKLPDVLRAYILYCHQRMGIRLDLSESTLAAVDHYEPEYLRRIQTVRPQESDGWFEDDDPDTEELERAVGGPAQLQSLGTQPLPDEPFEWAGISDDIRPVVQETLGACDRCADELLDIEHRTAMRRLLSRAAVGDPAVFRRKASPIRGAAAVAWVVARANDTVGPYGHGLTAQDLLAWFGVGGSISQRARPLLRAIGVDPNRLYGTIDLGTPDLLTSTRRIDIIAARDGLGEI